MKTKNILKIGIFSIVLFALLISPVLKSNSPQVKAASECEKEENKGTCVVSKTTKCIDLGDYVENSSLSCFGAGGGKNKCCIPNPTPGQTTIRHGYQTINVRLPEERPEGLCEKNFQDGMDQCAKRYGWGLDAIGCEFKVVIADMWCVTTKGILEGLGKMFAGLINLEINWILWALDPDTYGGFVKNEGVIQIWEMMRNLTNALLILGIIGIAIATIVRYKKYVWQNTLWKLVIVALLVNFSLVIGGMIIDVSNFLSGHFLSIAQEENDSLAPRIQKSFGYIEQESEGTKTLKPPDIFDEEKYELPKILGFDTATTTAATTTAEIARETDSYDLRFGNFFIIGFIMILVGGFAVISLLAIFIAILFRTLILIVLLGLSPIVFACWIFPDTEKYWKMWWEQFIKWCIFPVIFSFTLYIAVIAMSQMSKISIGAGSATQTIIQMVLFSMFLVGGLMFAIQGGGIFSKTVMQQASKAGAAVRGFAGYKVQKGVTGSETYRKAQEKLEGSKFAPLHDIGVWMSRQPGKIRAAELKQIAEDYKNRPPEQIRADMEAHKNDRARVAIGLNELIERKKITYEKDSEFIAIAQNQSNLNVPGLKKAHRGLYTDYFTKSEDMEEEIKKVQSTPRYIMPADKIEATKFAKINLRTKGVKEADSDAIKLGNWDNILERLEQQGILENKGTQYIDYFFRSLWDAGTTPEGYAAMFRSMDIGKRPKWAQEFVNSIGRTTHKSQKEVVAELDENNFYRNRFLTELLPPKPTP